MTIWEEQFKYGEQQGMQQGIQQGIQQGTELGDRNRRMKSARTMLADEALSYEQIARYTELSLEQVKELAAELKEVPAVT